MINLISFTFPVKCDWIVILKFYVLMKCVCTVHIISESGKKSEKYDLEFMMTCLLEKQDRLLTCGSFTDTMFVCVFLFMTVCWIWAYFWLSLRNHTNLTDKKKEKRFTRNICELYSCFLWCCCLCFKFTTNYILGINSSAKFVGCWLGFESSI